MFPKIAQKPLDMQHGERGRLIYDCERKWWAFGFCVGGDNGPNEIPNDTY